jgi:hypothetical protein
MKQDTITVAIIPADIQVPMRITEIPNTLEAKQKIVDGYIEAIRLRTNNHGMIAMDMYCNEEFLYRDDFGENLRAMALYLMSFYDVNDIRGDVVVIGGIDAEGDDVGLSEAQQEFLRKTFDKSTELR